jgi:hypothetical protein
LSFWQARTKIDAADRLFSQYIREKAGQRCERCGADGRMVQLECSHFIGRRVEAVRFDEDNADCLCRTCHAHFEDRKKTDYQSWKVQKLGELRFKALMIRSLAYQKKDRKMALIRVQAMMAELRKTQPPIIGEKV